MAGLNAARAVGQGDPLVLDRAEAYIGVLIDDLVTLGTREPYRMFTSRAEYRLLLRADNADLRLTGRGVAAGCVSGVRAAHFREKGAALEGARTLVRACRATPSELSRAGFAVNLDGRRRSAHDLLGYPNINLNKLLPLWPALAGLRPDIAEQIEIEGAYAGYLERQVADIRAYRRDEALALPADLDYAGIASLSAEARQKLEAARPATLGAAARISGVTPAALTALLGHVRRRDRAIGTSGGTSGAAAGAA
jgi:tRNA uridine 5-carboxymethylaminomethyl modification enzyme